MLQFQINYVLTLIFAVLLCQLLFYHNFSKEYDVINLGFGTGMPENLYMGKFSPKTAFYGVLAILSLRMRRNAQNTASGFKMDFGFGTGMPENL